MGGLIAINLFFIVTIEKAIKEENGLVGAGD